MEKEVRSEKVCRFRHHHRLALVGSDDHSGGIVGGVVCG